MGFAMCRLTMLYAVKSHVNLVLQEILDEVVRELHKVKDEIINGKQTKRFFAVSREGKPCQILHPLVSQTLSFFSGSHQTRNRQNWHILISSEQRQEESERRSWRTMDMQMHRHEDQGMFSQCFCELAMSRCKLQRRCANI